MKVLLIHNRYQQAGGEDAVVRRERALLIGGGNGVVEYSKSNNVVRSYGALSKAVLGARTVWAWDTYSELRTLLRREKCDLAHFHNTLPLISPSAYYACREFGMPVVQTLHNYRLLCPKGDLFCEGEICEKCVHHGLWSSILRGCYRGSALATASVAAMLAVHQFVRTWHRMVGCYITPTGFARSKFIEGGLPAEKIVIKPNFVYPDPRSNGRNGMSAREYGVFVGRLSEEKGLNNLIVAWARLKGRIPLVIVGDGPLRSRLESQVSRLGLSHIFFAGHVDPEQIPNVLGRARFLVFPSEWYETFGLVAVEAFACGVPVLASRLGAMGELVADGHTGLLFRPGDPDDLAAKVGWAWTHTKEIESMGQEARKEYETKYTADRNYAMLMDIYEQAIRSF